MHKCQHITTFVLYSELHVMQLDTKHHLVNSRQPAVYLKCTIKFPSYN